MTVGVGAQCLRGRGVMERGVRLVIGQVINSVQRQGEGLNSPLLVSGRVRRKPKRCQSGTSFQIEDDVVHVRRSETSN